MQRNDGSRKTKRAQRSNVKSIRRKEEKVGRDGQGEKMMISGESMWKEEE